MRSKRSKLIERAARMMPGVIRPSEKQLTITHIAPMVIVSADDLGRARKADARIARRNRFRLKWRNAALTIRRFWGRSQVTHRGFKSYAQGDCGSSSPWR